jgi:hypothetical protein
MTIRKFVGILSAGFLVVAGATATSLMEAKEAKASVCGYSRRTRPVRDAR